ncbi:MAG: molybdenum cofactor guanylyltransferase MobA [Rhodospirillaceae bacterium]|nr:molybdenum cofactor guanylyltransferase MobA [Rhodospirillaceae bacterium]
MNALSRNVTGVLLAGGKSQRMGGVDKCLLQLGSKRILEYAIERAQPQVDHLVLNVNGDLRRFSEFKLPMVSDSIAGFAGPLAGVLAGLDWSANNTPNSDWVVSFAADTPFFPRDLVTRLLNAVDGRGGILACASSGNRHHPVFGIWPTELRGELRRAIVQDDIRRIDIWTSRYDLKVINYDYEQIDPFFNINNPKDLKLASIHVERHAY